MKILVYIATSLDGFIARPDGGIDWLDDDDYALDDEDFGFNAFFATVDCLVLGRKSFEKVLSFGGWPYAGKRVIVLSSNPECVPEDFTEEIEVARPDSRELVSQLSAQGVQSIYVDGGQCIRSFLANKLVDELVLTTIPVLLGSGIPLFASGSVEQRLETISSSTYQNGFVQTRYRVVR